MHFTFYRLRYIMADLAPTKAAMINDPAMINDIGLIHPIGRRFIVQTAVVCVLRSQSRTSLQEDTQKNHQYKNHHEPTTAAAAAAAAESKQLPPLPGGRCAA